MYPLSIAVIAGDTVNYWIFAVRKLLPKKILLFFKKEYFASVPTNFTKDGARQSFLHASCRSLRTFALFVLQNRKNDLHTFSFQQRDWRNCLDCEFCFIGLLL